MTDNKKDTEYILSDREKTSITDMDQFNQLRNQLNYWNYLIAHKRKKANESKEKLLKILATKVYEKENTAKHNEENEIKKDIPLRYLRQEELKDTNVISVFESSLTRTIGIKKDELTDALIVVQVYYFDVFKDLNHTISNSQKVIVKGSKIHIKKLSNKNLDENSVVSNYNAKVNDEINNMYKNEPKTLSY